MRLNRGLIKTQAKTLIKNKLMKLFIVTLVVWIITGGVNTGFSIITNKDNFKRQFDNLYNYGISGDYDDFYSDRYDDFYGGYESDTDEDYFNDFTGEGNQYAEDFNNFNAKVPLVSGNARFRGTDSLGSSVNILSILLSPLAVTLTMFFVLFVRGKEFEMGAGLSYVFKETFNSTYVKKLGVSLLRSVITGLLCALFIIPGIIFWYSSYFAFQIMCDYPELSPWDAIKLSKKIVKGNRSELFALDLSFIPWYLLCAFVFPLIFVTPYVLTTQALYYENFRLRALATGKVSEDDFLSDSQKAAKYFARANGTYNPDGTQSADGYGNAAQSAAPNGMNYGFTPNAKIYYSPAMQPGSEPADIYSALTRDTVNKPSEPEIKQAAQSAPEDPEFISPRERFTEPKEPTEAFIEPKEPTEPKPLSDNGEKIDL